MELLCMSMHSGKHIYLILIPGNESVSFGSGMLSLHLSYNIVVATVFGQMWEMWVSLWSRATTIDVILTLRNVNMQLRCNSNQKSGLL